MVQFTRYRDLVKAAKKKRARQDPDPPGSPPAGSSSSSAAVPAAQATSTSAVSSGSPPRKRPRLAGTADLSATAGKGKGKARMVDDAPINPEEAVRTGLAPSTSTRQQLSSAPANPARTKAKNARVGDLTVPIASESVTHGLATTHTSVANDGEAKERAQSTATDMPVGIASGSNASAPAATSLTAAQKGKGKATAAVTSLPPASTASAMPAVASSSSATPTALRSAPPLPSGGMSKFGTKLKNATAAGSTHGPPAISPATVLSNGIPGIGRPPNGLSAQPGPSSSSASRPPANGRPPTAFSFTAGTASNSLFGGHLPYHGQPLFGRPPALHGPPLFARPPAPHGPSFFGRPPAAPTPFFFGGPPAVYGPTLFGGPSTAYGPPLFGRPPVAHAPTLLGGPPAPHANALFASYVGSSLGQPPAPLSHGGHHFGAPQPFPTGGPTPFSFGANAMPPPGLFSFSGNFTNPLMPPFPNSGTQEEQAAWMTEWTASLFRRKPAKVKKVYAEGEKPGPEPRKPGSRRYEEPKPKPGPPEGQYRPRDEYRPEYPLTGLKGLLPASHATWKPKYHKIFIDVPDIEYDPTKPPIQPPQYFKVEKYYPRVQPIQRYNLGRTYAAWKPPPTYDTATFAAYAEDRRLAESEGEEVQDTKPPIEEISVIVRPPGWISPAQRLSEEVLQNIFGQLHQTILETPLPCVPIKGRDPWVGSLDNKRLTHAEVKAYKSAVMRAMLYRYGRVCKSWWCGTQKDWNEVVIIGEADAERVVNNIQRWIPLQLNGYLSLTLQMTLPTAYRVLRTLAHAIQRNHENVKPDDLLGLNDATGAHASGSSAALEIELNADEQPKVRAPPRIALRKLTILHSFEPEFLGELTYTDFVAVFEMFAVQEMHFDCFAGQKVIERKSLDTVARAMRRPWGYFGLKDKFKVIVDVDAEEAIMNAPEGAKGRAWIEEIPVGTRPLGNKPHKARGPVSIARVDTTVATIKMEKTKQEAEQRHMEGETWVAEYPGDRRPRCRSPDYRGPIRTKCWNQYDWYIPEPDYHSRYNDDRRGFYPYCPPVPRGPRCDTHEGAGYRGQNLGTSGDHRGRSQSDMHLNKRPRVDDGYKGCSVIGPTAGDCPLGPKHGGTTASKNVEQCSVSPDPTLSVSIPNTNAHTSTYRPDEAGGTKRKRAASDVGEHESTEGATTERASEAPTEKRQRVAHADDAEEAKLNALFDHFNDQPRDKRKREPSEEADADGQAQMDGMMTVLTEDGLGNGDWEDVDKATAAKRARTDDTAEVGPNEEYSRHAHAWLLDDDFRPSSSPKDRIAGFVYALERRFIHLPHPSLEQLRPSERQRREMWAELFGDNEEINREFSAADRKWLGIADAYKVPKGWIPPMGWKIQSTLARDMIGLMLEAWRDSVEGLTVGGHWLDLYHEIRLAAKKGKLTSFHYYFVPLPPRTVKRAIIRRKPHRSPVPPLGSLKSLDNILMWDFRERPEKWYRKIERKRARERGEVWEEPPATRKLFWAAHVPFEMWMQQKDRPRFKGMGKDKSWVAESEDEIIFKLGRFLLEEGDKWEPPAAANDDDWSNERYLKEMIKAVSDCQSRSSKPKAQPRSGHLYTITGGADVDANWIRDHVKRVQSIVKVERSKWLAREEQWINDPDPPGRRRLYNEKHIGTELRLLDKDKRKALMVKLRKKYGAKKLWERCNWDLLHPAYPGTRLHLEVPAE